MKPYANIKSGLLSGLVAGLTLHWSMFSLLYPIVYQFERSGVYRTLSVIAFVASLFALALIGPLAVRGSEDASGTPRQGFTNGATAGLVAGVVIYFLVGVLANPLGLGVSPMVGPLFDTPPMTTDTDRLEAIKLVMRDAIPATYIGIVVTLVGTLLGAVEGWAYVKVRTWLQNRRAKQASQEPG